MSTTIFRYKKTLMNEPPRKFNKGFLFFGIMDIIKNELKVIETTWRFVSNVFITINDMYVNDYFLYILDFTICFLFVVFEDNTEPIILGHILFLAKT